MEEVEEDARNFREGIESLGAKRKDIDVRSDLKYADFSKLLYEIKEELKENSDNGEKTFLLFYYSGHGI